MNISLDNELLIGLLGSLYIQILLLGIITLVLSKFKLRRILLGSFCYLIGSIMLYNLFWSDFRDSFIANILFAGFKHLYFAPLIYLYIITIVDRENIIKKLISHLFFPTLISVLYIMFKFGFSHLYQKYYDYLAQILIIITILYYLGYIILFFKNTYKLNILVPFIRTKYNIFYNIFLSYILITTIISFLSVFVLDMSEIFFSRLNTYFYLPLGFIAYFLIVIFAISENSALKLFFNSKSPYIDKDLISKKDLIEKLIQQKLVSEKLYKNTNLRVKDVIKESDITVNGLIEYLRFYHKKAFNEFINDLRIEEFKNISTTTDVSKLSISGIAFECGFKSKATFYRIFKEKEGISPGEFLKKV